MLFIEKSYIIIVMIGEYKDLRRIEMGFIEQLKIKAKSNKKTIVLPEGMDRRTYEAAQQIVEEDFANIIISYVPGERMVESKSLKLYLFSFRNHGDFHEDCVNVIMKDLIKLMEPKYIEVWGKFTPRGGISIDPYCNYGKPGTKWEDVAFNRMANHDMYPEKVDNR